MHWVKNWISSHIKQLTALAVVKHRNETVILSCYRLMSMLVRVCTAGLLFSAAQFKEGGKGEFGFLHKWARYMSVI